MGCKDVQDDHTDPELVYWCPVCKHICIEYGCTCEVACDDIVVEMPIAEAQKLEAASRSGSN